MKILLFTILITLTALYAENTVHYDKKEIKPSSISKPNCPSTNLYTK